MIGTSLLLLRGFVQSMLDIRHLYAPLYYTQADQTLDSGRGERPFTQCVDIGEEATAMRFVKHVATPKVLPTAAVIHRLTEQGGSIPQ